MDLSQDAAQTLAVDVLKRLDLFDQVVDTFEVARRLGFQLELNWDFPHANSGFCFKHPLVCKIFLSSDEKWTRKQFSCAHEIGHLLDSTLDSTFGCQDATSEQEQFADWFAAELKMPEYWVRMLVKLYGPSPGILANCMQASETAMYKRLRSLGYEIDKDDFRTHKRDVWVYGNPYYRKPQPNFKQPAVAEQRAPYSKVNVYR